MILGLNKDPGQQYGLLLPGINPYQISYKLYFFISAKNL